MEYVTQMWKTVIFMMKKVIIAKNVQLIMHLKKMIEEIVNLKVYLKNIIILKIMELVILNVMEMVLEEFNTVKIVYLIIMIMD